MGYRQHENICETTTHASKVTSHAEQQHTSQKAAQQASEAISNSPPSFAHVWLFVAWPSRVLCS